MPPLLLTMGERPPEALQWIGTSFGLTQELYNFWHRSGFEPLYLRQTASDVTGAWQVALARTVCTFAPLCAVRILSQPAGSLQRRDNVWQMALSPAAPQAAVCCLHRRGELDLPSKVHGSWAALRTRVVSAVHSWVCCGSTCQG